MLDHYHLLINTLNEAETALLDDHSQELLRVFRSGYKRLNWNSLGNRAAPGHLTICFTCISCVYVWCAVCMQRPEDGVKAESLTSQEARQRAQVLPVSAHNAGVIGMHGLARDSNSGLHVYRTNTLTH